MNFFGHAVVAAWIDERPAYLLGSMLPDFEAMARVPLMEVLDADVRSGIELHHQTDEAFHRVPAFVALSAGALEELVEAGVRRGTARAVGHIATELFLDGCLAADPSRVDPYLGALASDANERLGWKDGGAAYSGLRDRLRAWGAPEDYADPRFVLERLHDALGHRPALAIVNDEADRVSDCLALLQKRVECEVRELLEQVRAALGFDD